MDIKEIKELVKLINDSNLSEFKLDDGDIKITIRTDKYSKGGDTFTQFAPSPVSVPAIAHQSSAPSSSPSESSSSSQGETPTDDSVQEANLLEIKSPIVGTFYRSPAPDKPPYVKVGDSVNEGDTVCIVEAMKLFNEIESEVSGKIVKVLVEEATPVEFDQVLFLVDPNA